MKKGKIELIKVRLVSEIYSWELVDRRSVTYIIYIFGQSSRIHVFGFFSDCDIKTSIKLLCLLSVCAILNAIFVYHSRIYLIYVFVFIDEQTGDLFCAYHAKSTLMKFCKCT